MTALVIASACVCAGCGIDSRPPDPDLSRLVSSDLGGGDSPRAWQIVFVGDGYGSDDLPAYRDLVDHYVAALTSHAGGFVAIAPEAFHFYRVDAVGPEWALGTHLDRYDSCGDPFIAADRDRVLRAASNALATPDVVVLVAHALDGRANGGVHLSDLDDWQTLEHELSHALFHLGDEYTEFQWCSERAPTDEATLLATPNVTALDDDAKWSGTVDGVRSGGGRWPCLHHPTDSCIMGGEDGGGDYCPVCAASVRDTIAARLCRPADAIPRVALVGTPPSTYDVGWSGQTLTFEAAAYDFGAPVTVGFLLDGVPVGEPGRPWLDLDLDTLAEGPHVIAARAIGAGGQIGTSAPHALDIRHITPLAPEITTLVAAAPDDGWTAVLVAATPVGGTIELNVQGRTVTVPITSTAATLVEVPTAATASGSVPITAVATTARGVRSAPRVIQVDVAAPTGDPPVVEDILAANGVGLAMLAATGPALDVAVHVHSCAPIVRIDASSSDGKLLGSIQPQPDHACDHLIWLSLAPKPGPVRFIVVDGFGRTGSADLVLPPTADLAATCGIDPHVDDPIVGLAHPAEIALGRSASVVRAAVVMVDGAPAVSFLVTRADGTRGLLVAAHDVPGPARDWAPVELRVTVLAQCAGGLAASTTPVPVTVDAVAPTLRVHPFVVDGELLSTEARDGGAVTVQTEITTYSTVVRAIDAARNVAQREVVPVVFPNDRAGCAP